MGRNHSEAGGLAVNYLIGDFAVAVASMTGLTLDTCRDRDLNPVRLLDVRRLDPWDRMRVVWALVAAYALYEQIHGPHPDRYCFYDRRRPAPRAPVVPERRRGVSWRLT